MFFKKAFIALCAIGVPFITLAQTSAPKFDVKNLLATSPEAAMLGRFGDIPIGYYTGTADVSIPIYTIKASGIEIPIVLSYHGSGIKVEDEATNVGLGWSLDPGGAIVHIVNGSVDNLDNLTTTNGYGFLKAHCPQGVYTERYEFGDAYFTGAGGCSFTDTEGADDYQALDAVNRGMGQPDIYQFNFPGYSGKFYINPEIGNVVLINPRQQDISFSKDGNSWTAKTMDGNIFHFSAVETVGVYPNISGETFKLSQIQLHDGKTVNFTYQDGYYSSFQYSESFHSDYPLSINDGSTNTVVPNMSVTDHTVKMLTNISTDLVSVDFNLESRDDMPVESFNGSTLPVKRIKSVDVKALNTGTKVKSFLFNYDYFVSLSAPVGGSFLTGHVGTIDPSVYSADARRLKLLSVQEAGYNTNGQQLLNQPYSFAYNESISMPLKTSYAKDFWGYYNNIGNTKLIPDLSFFVMSDDPDYNIMPANLTTLFAGANRSPNVAYMQVGMLKRITYPTGGYSDFTYEPHDFANHAYPDMNKITQSQKSGYIADYNLPSDTKSTTFTLSKDQVIPFNVIITEGPNTSHGFYALQPSTVTLTQAVSGVNTTLYTWQMDNSDLDNFNATGTRQWTTPVSITYTPGAVYTITANLPDNLGPQGTSTDAASVSVNFSYFDSPAASKISYGGGLRVSSITNYTQSGAIANKKVIKYQNADNTSSGLLMSPVKPLYRRTMYGMINSSNSTGNPNYSAAKADVWFISSESAVPFSDAAQGNMIGYTRVEEDDVAQDGSLNGRHVFNYNNAESEWHVNTPANPNPLNGLIFRDQIYSNGSVVPLQETTYSYDYINAWLYTGYKEALTFVGTPGCGNAYDYSLSAFQPSRNYEHEFLICSYPFNSFWYLPSGKTTVKTDNGQSVITTEAYAYNTKGQMVKMDTYDSRLRKKSVSNLYPLDNPGDPMSATLISNGLYNNLQQQTTLLNDNTELAKDKVSYRVESGLVVQNDITRSYNGATMFTDVTFDRYGPDKTLRQYTQRSTPIVLLWSFNNTYPVAEIKNTSYDAVEAALGGKSVVDNFGLEIPAKGRIDSFLATIKSALPNAQVTIYTYAPLIGMTSTTDAKGIPTYYEYDSFMRLMNIKDKDGNIVKHVDYHYQNQ
ncbi:hypothetical protein [Mucilaginibacter jinjuensis]|uniref:YD repeat-containing protein n=1 Tax=Mucilaginibacter jinjuensis TaxID=1176721 RepID=A0ABY7TAV6_9SPHI|nr:hypothetical protein [Mucilaginibacter jinjuensis]WCT13634.1 hypothetical protein PQO05_06760 [Mucilaginibacter jinjuensis]